MSGPPVTERERIARLAYAAFDAHDARGDIYPWAAMPESMQRAWLAAADALIADRTDRGPR
jgi:hypothetical protein